jgi:hypothetical protein
MKRPFGRRPQLEILEDRTVPALLLQLDGGGNLTGIFGVPDGDVDLLFTASDEINVVEDGNDLGTYSVPGNLTVSLGNSNAPATLTIDLDDNEFSSNMKLTLGNALGGYSVLVDGGPGDAGAISGSLSIVTGNGDDTVFIGEGGAGGGLVLGGNLTVDMKAGVDEFNIFDDVAIEGSVRGTNVNLVEIFDTPGTPVRIEGNLYLTSLENQDNFYFIDGNTVTGNVTIDGSLIIKTGNGPTFGPGDTIDIQGTVLGSVIASLAGGANAFTLNATSVVHGNVVVTGGNGVDVVNLASTGSGLGAIVLGNVTISLKNGSNTFDVDTDTTILGRNITYIGGNNDDNLIFEGSAVGARFSALLAGGVDTLELGSDDLALLYVDFGSNTDIFNQTIPVLTAPKVFRNLP